ncbi:hypothetical protein [Scytonema sp. PCC 10023]|uniref:hypothetical protein n=1 Tax=Scytonema sp. PCC 10023 TaxID=1680591 RepID=UPI0039C6D598
MKKPSGIGGSKPTSRALSGWLWYAPEGNLPRMDSLGQHICESLEASSSHNHDCSWSRRGNLVACDIRCPNLVNLRLSSVLTFHGMWKVRNIGVPETRRILAESGSFTLLTRVC